ncbi:hypothetical protein SO802_013399 [Lithocarpus litseifolius]|uniref:DC1 domain-containing protein n=1 Tax=Lithocarpus litseifolius TaxID=425828 RepID=A0AAW2D5H3_9ROSI
MDQLLESKGKSGDSMAANLGEEKQTQKGKEVGDQQKEQEAEAEVTEEDDHEGEEDDHEEEDDQEDNHEEEDDNEDEIATEHLKSVPKEMKQLQHFIHPEHPLVFNEDRIYGKYCYGCREPILGPSYSCKECRDYEHHKSCAELPLGLLHHPLHPFHPLLLFDEYNSEVNKKFSNCDVCKEYRGEYCYFCYRCNFKLHIKCGSLAPTTEASQATEVHHHPLTSFWKLITFTCDLCGKEDKGMPYVCTSCGFWIHTRCTNFPRRLKVVRHNHPLNLIHSLQLHQSNSQFCQLCFLILDTNYGLYYCSTCHFAAHLHCAIHLFNMEDINLLELKEEESAESKAILENVDSKLDQSFDSEICKVIKTTLGEDGTEIATEIKHFSHEHHLKLTDEVPNNKICIGCVRAILPPSFYSCVDCSFFLHISCTKLPKIKQHPLHQHPLTLTYDKYSFMCDACYQRCNGFNYKCGRCDFELDVQCSLTSNTLTHACHQHPLYLSITNYEQKCSICDSEEYRVFRCTTCKFVLDFKCATLPQTAWYYQHEHLFTLCYTPEDDSGEYYCDICEEERDPKLWFYYYLLRRMLAHERLPWLWQRALALAACPGLGSLPMGGGLGLGSMPMDSVLALATCPGLGCVPFNVVKGSNGMKAVEKLEFPVLYVPSEITAYSLDEIPTVTNVLPQAEDGICFWD